jgi:hypothetical protein
MVMVPANWTDRGEPSATQRLSYEMLADLAATLHALKAY